MPLRSFNRQQAWLLPPTLGELIPADHPARFIAEFVDSLGRETWIQLEVSLEGEVLGSPAYHPRALLSVWLYGFMTGVRSSRKLEAAYEIKYPTYGLPDGSIPITTLYGGFIKPIENPCESC